MSEYRPNRKNFTPLGSVIEKVLRQYRPVRDQRLIDVWEVWDRTVGASIAENARPAAFKADTLLVNVVSSTWRHHMRFLEKDLIAKLNAALGTVCIRSIKFKVGAV